MLNSVRITPNGHQCTLQVTVGRSLPITRVLKTGHQSIRQPVHCQAGNDKDPNFGDELLDFMYAGKKLRKWYGEEGMVLPKDGGKLDQEPEQSNNDDDAEEYTGPRDAILVLDADTSPMAEQALLQLILKRSKAKCLVKNVDAAKSGFGPYVDVVGESGSSIKRLLRDVTAVICCSKLNPAVIDGLKQAKVNHIVLLSMVGSSPKGFSLFGGGEQGVLSDATREEKIRSSGINTTIVRVGGLNDQPGGISGLALGSGNGSGSGDVSREDVARVLAEFAVYARKSEGTVVCSLSSTGAGNPGDYSSLISQVLTV